MSTIQSQLFSFIEEHFAHYQAELFLSGSFAPSADPAGAYAHRQMISAILEQTGFTTKLLEDEPLCAFSGSYL
jgi:hypothetical protein